MEQLIEAVLRALERAGVRAVKLFPPCLLPRLKAPVTAVGIASAKAPQHALYDYLGMLEREDGSLAPLYGRQLEAELLLQVYCPRSFGGRKCMEEADRLLTLLSGQPAGMSLGECRVGVCAYDAESDCFQCAVTAEAKAYLYALASDDETEFTDFILKGDLK